MTARWPFIAETLAARLSVVAPLVHRKSMPLPDFKLLELPAAIVDAPIDADPAGWEAIAHQTYWGRPELNFIMKTSFDVPAGWNHDHLALHLPLGGLGDIFNHPEALVYVNQTPIGSADRFHHTIQLPRDLGRGQAHTLALHGWTGLAGWPPDPHAKNKLYMGAPALVERDPTTGAFLHLARCVLDSAKTLGRDTDTGRALITLLDDAMRLLDTRVPVGEAFYASAPAALLHLQQGLTGIGAPLDVTLHGIGHAHMDIAYLWTIDQIRLKNARTYTNVLRLMDENPSYTFSHSQPQLYDYTAQDYPELFEQIKARVAQGRWEVLGGMWVEPDLNVPGGEALIRQLTLGRGYFKDTFGDVETPVLWLPDTFGFPAQIPQLMTLAGLEGFVTNKLNWNQYNPVPSSTHHWQGLDGSRVFAHVLTTPRDVQYLPFPTNYKSDLSAAEVLGTWTRSTAPQTIRDLPICYGYGDGGGGPTEDLLAKADAYCAMPAMPKFKHSTVRAAIDAIKDTPDLPVWTGEHYMEGHRGTYTSQGWIKRANRRAEWALHEAEALASMAGQRVDLDAAWKLLCLNQFHDILTGTSVTAVFEDARRDYARIGEIVEPTAKRAASALATSEPAVLNTAPTSGPRLALVPTGTGQTTDAGQTTGTGPLVYFDHMPGYCAMPLSAATTPQAPVDCTQNGDSYTLENAMLRVVINSAGQLTEVFDKGTCQQVLAGGQAGNTLLAFEDRPICWDAWDIDPTYTDRVETVQGDTQISIAETGPLRAAITVETRWRNSTIKQKIQLCAHSKRLDFVTEVDWHEQHTLLKAAFPTALAPQSAQYDVQWGRVSRSTSRDTSFDAARFEVPAHKWASIQEGNHAVALLNDCKYGYDVLGGCMRITLIKSATSPDPIADQGQHSFTYALLPYGADEPATLDHEAYDLNVPLRYLPAGGSKPAAAPLVQSSAANVIIETVKPASDGNGTILRVFEAHGKAVTTELHFGAKVKSCETVSIFEQFEGPLQVRDNGVSLPVTPFQIITLRAVF